MGFAEDMIISIRRNKRSRPTLRKRFSRSTENPLNIKHKNLHHLTIEEQQRLRQKLVYYKTKYRKRILKQVLISVIAMAVVLALFYLVITIFRSLPADVYRSNPVY